MARDEEDWRSPLALAFGIIILVFLIAAFCSTSGGPVPCPVGQIFDPACPAACPCHAPIGGCTCIGACGNANAACDVLNPCCIGFACSGGICVSMMCVASGGACSAIPPIMMCCPGNTCVGGVCTPWTCGDITDACDAANPCCAGLICSGGVCVSNACRNVGEVCTAIPCCPGLNCVGGFCASPFVCPPPRVMPAGGCCPVNTTWDAVQSCCIDPMGSCFLPPACDHLNPPAGTCTGNYTAGVSTTCCPGYVCDATNNCIPTSSAGWYCISYAQNGTCTNNCNAGTFDPWPICTCDCTGVVCPPGNVVTSDCSCLPIVCPPTFCNGQPQNPWPVCACDCSAAPPCSSSGLVHTTPCGGPCGLITYNNIDITPQLIPGNNVFDIYYQDTCGLQYGYIIDVKLTDGFGSSQLYSFFHMPIAVGNPNATSQETFNAPPGFTTGEITSVALDDCGTVSLNGAASAMNPDCTCPVCVLVPFCLNGGVANPFPACNCDCSSVVSDKVSTYSFSDGIVGPPWLKTYFAYFTVNNIAGATGKIGSMYLGDCGKIYLNDNVILSHPCPECGATASYPSDKDITPLLVAGTNEFKIETAVSICETGPGYWMNNVEITEKRSVDPLACAFTTCTLSAIPDTGNPLVSTITAAYAGVPDGTNVDLRCTTASAAQSVPLLGGAASISCDYGTTPGVFASNSNYGSISCDTTAKVCSPVLDACGGGVPCCGALNCEAPTCGGLKTCCRTGMSACTADAQCCHDSCQGGTCKCISDGNACTSDKKCCSGHCVAGVCERGMGGDPCANPDDCEYCHACIAGLCT